VSTYEIEFFPVGTGASSGDAIVMRYWDGAAWRVGLIDGGYEDTGKQLCNHIRQWYGTSTVDFVVSTHPDDDHMSGLRSVLAEMTVRELWMHVPWCHAERIQKLFRSRRWTIQGLEAEFRRQYNYVSDIVDLALAQGTTIKLPFQGEQIGPFTVMSPSLDMYEGLLPQFRDAPAPDQDMLKAIGHWLEGIGRRITRTILKDIREAWDTETLREGGITSAENESSVVLYGDLGHGGILLTGDAGLRALWTTITYAAMRSVDFSKLWLFQVPHHGSRNNIGPSVLDRIIGPPVRAGQTRSTVCIVSAGPEDKEHPRQVVVNALWRRGLQPVVTRSLIVRYYMNMQDRANWNPLTPIPFSPVVERYD
jgi:beta-lactamase superfamily II metal-dependent hydrolase